MARNYQTYLAACARDAYKFARCTKTQCARTSVVPRNLHVIPAFMHTLPRIILAFRCVVSTYFTRRALFSRGYAHTRRRNEESDKGESPGEMRGSRRDDKQERDGATCFGIEKYLGHRDSRGLKRIRRSRPSDASYRVNRLNYKNDILDVDAKIRVCHREAFASSRSKTRLSFVVAR